MYLHLFVFVSVYAALHKWDVCVCVWEGWESSCCYRCLIWASAMCAWGAEVGWGVDAPWKKGATLFLVCFFVLEFVFFVFPWGVDLRWGQGATFLLLMGLPWVSWDLQEPAADMTVTNRCATNCALVENNLEKRKKWGQIWENGGEMKPADMTVTNRCALCNWLCTHWKLFQTHDEVIEQACKPRSYASPKLWPSHWRGWSLELKSPFFTFLIKST